jgi:hypothetical protein
MTDLSPEEQLVADTLGHEHGMSGSYWRVEAAAAVAALDLPSRDARVRAQERAAVRAELLVMAADQPDPYAAEILGLAADWVAPAATPTVIPWTSVVEEIAAAIEAFAESLEPVEVWEDAINMAKDAARIAREHSALPRQATGD